MSAAVAEQHRRSVPRSAVEHHQIDAAVAVEVGGGDVGQV